MGRQCDTVGELYNGFWGGSTEKVLQRDDSCIVLEMNGNEIFKFFL